MINIESVSCIAEGEACNLEAMSGREGIKTSMAKPESGIRLKAKNVFQPALDSLIRLIIKGFVKENKATPLQSPYANMVQRNTYTNQRLKAIAADLLALNSIGLKPISCRKYLLK